MNRKIPLDLFVNDGLYPSDFTFGHGGVVGKVKPHPFGGNVGSPLGHMVPEDDPEGPVKQMGGRMVTDGHFPVGRRDRP